MISTIAPKTAFICGTPLQILGCIDLVFHQMETDGAKPDLYLRHDFNGSGELAQRLAAADIFDNVFQKPIATSPKAIQSSYSPIRTIRSKRCIA